MIRYFKKIRMGSKVFEYTLILICLCLSVLLFYVIIECKPTNSTVVRERMTEKHVNWAPYSFNNGTWHHNVSVCASLRQRFHTKVFQRHQLAYRFKPLAIYTFDPFHDWISNHIVSLKTFEPESVQLVSALIKRVPDVDFLDIGANLGVFSLQMADAGKRAVAIEISRDCVQHLCASVLDNQLQDKITIIHNGLGADHAPVEFVTTLKGNHGIHFIESRETREAMHKEFDITLYNIEKEWYPSVRLDDLIKLDHLQDYSKIFIKIDVEGFEHKVLQGATRFLEEKEVVGVLMEWNKQYNTQTGTYIINTMKTSGFEPYNCEHKDMLFNIRTFPLKNPCILLQWENVRQKFANILWIPAGLDW